MPPRSAPPRVDDRPVNEAEPTRTLREALESIIVRCEEGDHRTDWLPTIASIARTALDRASSTEEPEGISAKMDRWAADLDARFKRANLGSGCWNCGCPDAQYVRSFSATDARASGPPPLDARQRAVLVGTIKKALDFLDPEGIGGPLPMPALSTLRMGLAEYARLSDPDTRTGETP